MTHEELSSLKPGDTVFMQLKFNNKSETKLVYTPVTIVRAQVSATVRLPNGVLKICPAHTLFKEKKENEAFKNRS